jgi:curli biogenesis system outer membrane secretion channel CsgG
MSEHSAFLKPLSGALLALLALGFSAPPAAAETKAGSRKSIEKSRAEEQAQLPVCSQPLGTIALSEPEQRWWGDLGLGSPEALIRIYVQKSKCFKLVNRSERGMAAMSRERELMGSGELRRGGTVGKGQMVEADFTLIPDIVTGNANRSGTGIGGAIGGLLGGPIAGAILGGIDIKKKSANVVLNMVNNKSSEEFVYEGQAKKTDLGWGAGGGFFAGGVFGGAGATGYDNTEIGQVIALAYLDAYKNMLSDMGALTEATQAQQSERAVTTKRPGRMFASASTGASVVKQLDAGAMLYPTGNKEAGMWEVEDEMGSKGWVPEAGLEVAK